MIRRAIIESDQSDKSELKTALVSPEQKWYNHSISLMDHRI